MKTFVNSERLIYNIMVTINKHSRPHTKLFNSLYGGLNAYKSVLCILVDTAENKISKSLPFTFYL